jgi:hypothetical protein
MYGANYRNTKGDVNKASIYQGFSLTSAYTHTPPSTSIHQSATTKEPK